MNAGNFGFVNNAMTVDFWSKFKALEPIDSASKALAIVCLTVSQSLVNLDYIFNELKKHEGFNLLLTMLDYKTDSSDFDVLVSDIVDASEIAEQYNEGSEEYLNQNLEFVYKLLDDISEIRAEGAEFPEVLKIRDFGFKFLYFLALDPDKMTEENILINSANFEELILKYSDDFNRDLKEIKHVQTKGLKREFEHVYKNKIFDYVHDFEDVEPISAALTILDDNCPQIKNDICLNEILDFLIWYKNSNFGGWEPFRNIKNNVRYCNHVAEKILKKELPLVFDVKKYEMIERGIYQDYLNDEFLKYYWDEIAQEENHLTRRYQRDLNKYLDVFQYEKFKNVFDFDEVEVYNKDDLNDNLNNFESIFNTFKDLVLNIFFNESNEIEWGEDGFIYVLKFCMTAQHYFDLFEKFKINYAYINETILTKLTELLTIHIYLKTYVNGFSFKEDLNKFFDKIKLQWLEDIKNNFNNQSETNDSNE